MAHQDIVYVCLSQSGLALATKLAAETGGEVHGLEGRCDGAPFLFSSTSDHLIDLFHGQKCIIAVCAAGIVIRILGAHLSDKWSESPVLAVSETGASVVPLLGGHHGAISLAHKIADITGGHAAITTASDATSHVALDMPPQGYVLADKDAAKSAMAAILNGAKVTMTKAGPLQDWLSDLPQGDDPQGNDVDIIYSDQAVPAQDHQLVYHKADLMLGVGCARGCSAEELEALFASVLEKHNLSEAMIGAIGSLDLKADEPAIHALANRLSVPFRVFDAGHLSSYADQVSDPSDVVASEVGTPSVSEASALALAGDDAALLATKEKSANATMALARNIIASPALPGRKPGKVSLIGIGPGKSDWRTPEATRLVAEADLLVGYRLYIDLLGASAASKPAMHFALGEEELRCRTALEEAAKGQDVALICSGDAGIYAMGALVFELLARDEADGGVSEAAKRVEVITAPGISALQAAAARSGAILGHDFCTISLSDLLTPWQVIEQRLHGAGAGDFVIAFYNPVSMRRRTQLARAREILLQYRGGDVPVLLASNLGRVQEKLIYRTLETLDVNEVDMLTVVMIGSSQSAHVNLGRSEAIFTPRGYAKHLDKTAK